MSLAELKEMASRTPVKWRLSNGWYQNGYFVRLIKVTTFGKMTLNDLMSKDFKLENGREVTEAMVEYIDDKGKVKRTTISTRKLIKA